MDSDQIDVSTIFPAKDPLCEANHLLRNDDGYSALLLAADDLGTIAGMFKNDQPVAPGSARSLAPSLEPTHFPTFTGNVKELPMSTCPVGSSPQRRNSITSVDPAHSRQRTGPVLQTAFMSPAAPTKSRKIKCETPPSILDIHFPSTPFSDCTSQAESQIETLFLSAPRFMPDDWESFAKQETMHFRSQCTEATPGSRKNLYPTFPETRPACCGSLSRGTSQLRGSNFSVAHDMPQSGYEGQLPPVTHDRPTTSGPRYTSSPMTGKSHRVPMPLQSGPHPSHDLNQHQETEPVEESVPGGSTGLNHVSTPARQTAVPVGHGAIPLSSDLPATIPKIRRYSTSTASKFCHICARSAKLVQLVTCRNVRFGLCRKTICYKCFTEQDWNWELALARPNDFWCSHCLSVCPRNAQCRTYERTNERRRQEGVKKRQLRKAQKGSATDKKFQK